MPKLILSGIKIIYNSIFQIRTILIDVLSIKRNKKQSVVDECNITTYIDGEKVGSSSSPSTEKWTLRDVAYFFADDNSDGIEEGEINIAELRYWNVALSGVHVNQLGAVEYARADVNRDGVIDSADIVAVIKEMPDGDKKADVNGDSVIDSADIVAVIKEMK